MFGKRLESKKIRNMRLEHMRETCALKGEIEYYKANAQETAHTCHFLAERMDRDYKELASSRAEKERLHQLLKGADAAMKELQKKNEKLAKEFDSLDERYQAALKELDELYKEHDAVIREIRDAEHSREEAESA